MKEINNGQATAITSPAPLMLVCTTKENIRRTRKAVLAAPGISLKNVVMVYGSSGGRQKGRLEETLVALQSVEGSDILILKASRIAFVVSPGQTVESGDHYLYLCNVEKIVADESKEALFV